MAHAAYARLQTHYVARLSFIGNLLERRTRHDLNQSQLPIDEPELRHVKETNDEGV